jgi:hypothetical protein
MTVSSSTIAGNTTSGVGAGIDSSATLTVSNSTITGNTVLNRDPQLYCCAGIFISKGTLTLSNSIVAGNFAVKQADLSGVSGLLTVDASSSNNLIGDGTGLSGISDGTNGNRIGTSANPLNPKLAPLNNYGGPTQTAILGSGSPALEAGGPSTTLTSAVDVSATTLNVAHAANLAVTPGLTIQIDNEQLTITTVNTTTNTFTVQRGVNGTTPAAHALNAPLYPATDQRGLPRVVNGLLDIGAVQRQASENIPVVGFESTSLNNVSVGTFRQGDGSLDPSAFSASINWGDGITDKGSVMRAGSSYSVQGSHTYTDEGSFTITVTVTASGLAPITFATTAFIQEELLPDGTRGSANQRFVLELYRDLLHRTITAAEMPPFTSWVAYLDTHSRSDTVLNFETSPEFLIKQVDDLYRRYLHRSVDPTGMNGSLSLLQNKGTLEQVAAGILGSVEYFRDRAASANSDFLDALALDLHRPPLTGSDRTAALQTLASESRVQFAADALNTDSYRQMVVNDIYQRYLEHQPDAAGLRDWTAQLRSGVTDQMVLAQIVGDSVNSEFFNKTAS